MKQWSRNMRKVLQRSADGFSLLEVVFSTGILAAGLLSLAGAMAIGMQHMGGSSPGLIAREKAREAVESVHTARDTRVITWAQIKNTQNGGVFVAGAQSMRTPGVDGLVNTADDGSTEQQRSAGLDGLLGTSDDVLIPLTDYTREIQITDIVDANNVVNPNLRQLRVIVTYKVGGMTRNYTLTTFISSFS